MVNAGAKTKLEESPKGLQKKGLEWKDGVIGQDFFRVRLTLVGQRNGV